MTSQKLTKLRRQNQGTQSVLNSNTRSATFGTGSRGEKTITTLIKLINYVITFQIDLTQPIWQDTLSCYKQTNKLIQERPSSSATFFSNRTKTSPTHPFPSPLHFPIVSLPFSFPRLSFTKYLANGLGDGECSRLPQQCLRRSPC